MSTSATGQAATLVSCALDEVLARFEAVRVADRSAAGDEDRLAWLEKVVEAERRVSALKSVLIAEADEAGSAMRARHTHLQDWLTRSGQETPRQATGALWRARELERHPQVRDAATSGKITLGQAAAINHVLNSLPATLGSAQKQQAEDLILIAAEHTPPERLRTMTEALIGRVAPERAETDEQCAARLAERDVRANQRRSLRFGPEVDGSIEFSGNLPVVDGRRLQRAVQTIADRGYRAAKDTHDRKKLADTPAQRLADGLVTLVEVGEAIGRRDGSRVSIPPGATQLMVVIPYEDLQDRASSHGLLMDGAQVSAGELRRLACSADIIPAVLGGGSTIMDVGFAHRLAPAALRMAIALRDGGCAFPGCTAPVEHCDLHHIVPWQEGGPTTRGNIVALCRVHHTLVEPSPPVRQPDGSLAAVDQWEVMIDGRGLPEFRPPAALDPARTPIRRAACHVATLLDTG